MGDESFKNKSKQRMDEFWQDHFTILLVSHSMDLIQNACNQVIWLEQGKIKLIGDAKEVVKSYLDSVT